MKKPRLTRAAHIRLGDLLKHIRADLFEAALQASPYPSVSSTLKDLAGELIVPRSFLESRMFEETGNRDLARSSYFGELPTKEAAE